MASLTKHLAFAGLIVAATFSSGTAHAQGVAGTWVFHSGPSGECPSLDWDVSSDGQRLRGFIAWGEEGKSFARINGTLAGTEFKLTATEVAGSRIADITGRVEADKTLLVTITGTGGPCDGKTIKVPWFSAAAVGGGG